MNSLIVYMLDSPYSHCVTFSVDEVGFANRSDLKLRQTGAGLSKSGEALRDLGFGGVQIGATLRVLCIGRLDSHTNATLAFIHLTQPQARMLNIILQVRVVDTACVET